MMVAYHAVYDVELLAPGLGPDPFRGFWGAVPEATGSLFLLVAGVSLAVSDARLVRRGASSGDRLRRHLRHAFVVLAAAMLVTVATRIVFDERYVRFGILHAIGVSIVVAALTVRLGRWNLLCGGAALLGGDHALQMQRVEEAGLEGEDRVVAGEGLREVALAMMRDGVLQPAREGVVLRAHPVTADATQGHLPAIRLQTPHRLSPANERRARVKPLVAVRSMHFGRRDTLAPELWRHA